MDGAFNKTRLTGVVKAMRDNDYPDTFTNWYEAFVMNQIASVDAGMAMCKRADTKSQNLFSLFLFLHSNHFHKSSIMQVKLPS